MPLSLAFYWPGQQVGTSVTPIGHNACHTSAAALTKTVARLLIIAWWPARASYSPPWPPSPPALHGLTLFASHPALKRAADKPDRGPLAFRDC